MRVRLHVVLPILLVALAFSLSLRWSAELQAPDPHFLASTPNTGEPIEPRSAAGLAEGLPGEGFVIWESNRDERWRLWMRRLDQDAAPRRLTPDEGRRAHCCPHIAPDGDALAFLSLEPGPERYPDGPERGVLRLVRPRDGELLAEIGEARTYGEHRAAIWHGRRTLLYLDGGDGATVRLELDEDFRVRTREVVIEAGHPKWGWLISPGFTHATHGVPTFSLLDPATHTVTELQAYGGCQPYFSSDGRWGYWTAGAGGPIDRIELATGRRAELLAKNDPRLGKQGYLYFPMLSPDRRLLAFAASDDEHHHFTANYDIYVAEVHPEALALVGTPLRLSDHPATDRFPDVYLERPHRPPPPVPTSPNLSSAPPESSDTWPSDRRGLLFVWRDATSPNRVFDPRRNVERSFPIERRGLVRLDHHERLDLGGGAAEVAPVGARNVLEGIRGANAMSLEMTITPRLTNQEGAILAFSAGRRNTRNLVLSQEGRQLVLTLLTAGWGPVENRVELGEAGLSTSHLLVAYRPGRLVVYRDGEARFESADVRGDFFHWKLRPLWLGDEARKGRDWSGIAEGVAFYGRFLEAAEAQENAKRYTRLRGARADVPRIAVHARLLRRTPTPTLDEITPYREALATYLYETVEPARHLGTPGPVRMHTDLPSPGARLRVAHWALLDRRETPAAQVPEGHLVELVLEPFEKNPQLESAYLANRAPAPVNGTDTGALWFATR